MPVLQNTETYPGTNQYVVGAIVEITLTNAPGYVNSSPDFSIDNDPLKLETNASGAWSQDVISNELIQSEAGVNATRYMVTIRFGNKVIAQHGPLFVLNGAGPYSVQEALASALFPPEPVDSGHVLDATAAHNASAIAVTPVGTVAAITVQAAIQELDSEKSAVGHTHAASAITNAPLGSIAATTVQGAIDELESEKAGAAHTHSASVITYTPPSPLTATTVEDAIDALVALITPIRKTSDQSSTTTSLANVTDLLFAIAANKVVFFEFDLFVFSASSTTGISIAIDVPASATVKWAAFWTLDDNETGSASASGDDTAYVTTAALTSSTVPGVVRITGVCVNSTNAGNVQLRFASETGTSVTIQANSWGRGSST